MARCCWGTCSTLQQSQLSSPAHLSPLPAQTWWSHWAGQAERRGRGVVNREMLYWKDWNLLPMIMESHQLGLPLKTITSKQVHHNSEESHTSGINTVNSTYRCFWILNLSASLHEGRLTDSYINIGLATSSETVMLLSLRLELPEAEVEKKKKSIFDSLLLKSLASIKLATVSFQPFTTHTSTYIHSETHTLPTHTHTNPTPIHTGPLWGHKTETTSRSKNTQGTCNSLLNQSNRCVSRRTHSLSHALKAHLNATNMFYDKWMKNMRNTHTRHREYYIALPSRDRPASADIGLLELTLQSFYCECENPMRGL